MGVHRSHVQRQRRQDSAETAVRNRVFKIAERKRRDARMLDRVRKGSLPYSPGVMSWLSDRLEKKASRITAEDVKPLLG